MTDSRETPTPAAAPPRAARQGWTDSFRRESFGADWGYVRRVLIVIVLVGLAWFLWSISRVLLLVFAAVLIAVLLHALADVIRRWTRIPARWSLPLAVLLVVGIIAGLAVLFGAQIAGQGQQVLEQLPKATDAIGDRLGIPDIVNRMEDAIQANAGTSVVSRMAGLGFTVVGGLTDCLLVIVAGIYLAADPDVYRRGLAKLFPPTQHGRIEDALDATGTALRLWFGGQLLSMSLVGAVYGLAFWFIGLPSPLALGVMAGVLDFIPYLGPILGAIPALILASTVDTTTVLWTLAAVVIIQQLEGNVLMPVIQRRAVELPPALGLFAIVVFGLLFGFIGVFLAVPLTVAIMVLVKKLWIRETLGEATTLPGEGADSAGS
jgi:predicted PurR-regulated permease PerM